MDKNIIAQLDVILESAPLIAACGADVIFASAFNVATDLINEGHLEEAAYLIKNFPVTEVLEVSNGSNPIEGLATVAAIESVLSGLEG